MRFVIFTHSVISDWNHGNARSLPGIPLVSAPWEDRARHTCAHRVRELLAIVEKSHEKTHAGGAA